ncbi:hypothetical protein ABE073_04480 [Lederbergia citrisecunda]|uniref:hypothetical protein n=1 Tax=Lederbergia citrisecunda TaxID=2833583 RepID=UPI003D2B4986
MIKEDKVIRDSKADLELISHYKDLLYGFNLSGLKRTEALQLVKLAEGLYESNLQALKYYDEYQKAALINKNLNIRHNKLVKDFNKQSRQLKELEGVKTL